MWRAYRASWLKWMERNCWRNISTTSSYFSPHIRWKTSSCNIPQSLPWWCFRKNRQPCNKISRYATSCFNSGGVLHALVDFMWPFTSSVAKRSACLRKWPFIWKSTTLLNITRQENCLHKFHSASYLQVRLSSTYVCFQFHAKFGLCKRPRFLVEEILDNHFRRLCKIRKSDY
jgi:hypothetical protein